MITRDDIKVGMEVCLPNLTHSEEYGKGVFGVVLEIKGTNLRVLWEDDLKIMNTSINGFNVDSKSSEYTVFGKNKDKYVKFSDFSNINHMVGVKVIASFALRIESAALFETVKMDSSIVGVIKRVAGSNVFVDWKVPQGFANGSTEIEQSYNLSTNYALLYHSKVTFTPDPVKHQEIDNQFDNLVKFIETL